MDPEYEMNKVLKDPDIDPREAFQRVLSIAENLSRSVKDHPAYCECPGCSWRYPVDPENRWHGTMNGYQYHKCRCERCRKASRDYNRNRR